MVAPPSRVVADTTGNVTAPEVTDDVRVVCCDLEVYLRVVIYLPIGCSGRGLGIEASALMILLQGAACTGLEVVLLH